MKTTETVHPRGSRPGSALAQAVRPHGDAGFLVEFPRRGPRRRLVLLDESTRQRPHAAERFPPTSHQEDASISTRAREDDDVGGEGGSGKLVGRHRTALRRFGGPFS